jgi:hypothetical protein
MAIPYKFGVDKVSVAVTVASLSHRKHIFLFLEPLSVVSIPYALMSNMSVWNTMVYCLRLKLGVFWGHVHTPQPSAVIFLGLVCKIDQYISVMLKPTLPFTCDSISDCK